MTRREVRKEVSSRNLVIILRLEFIVFSRTRIVHPTWRDHSSIEMQWFLMLSNITDIVINSMTAYNTDCCIRKRRR